jgi:hypothetical protein
MGVLLVAAGGFIYYTKMQPPPTTIAAVTTPPAPATTLAPPPPTVAITQPPTPAPQPSIEARGKFMKAAKAAFNRADYDEAINQARRALAEDPGDVSAKSLIESALGGQKAELRFRAAEGALRAGDYEKAVAEANAGRDLAPWDGRAPEILTRIQEAQRQAAEAAAQRDKQNRQAQLTAQVAGFVNGGDAALAAQKYDDAIALYDKALGLDGNNTRALNGKSSAVQARALAQAGIGGGGTRPGPSHTFASGKTSASSAETQGGGAVPPGFDPASNIDVKKGSTAADLPGKINFDVEPDVPKAGERYTVKVFLLNEGGAPIQVKDMVVSTTINGKKISGPVNPQTRDVAPQQKALLMSTTEMWKEETSGWAMEVTVHTARGERYSNQVTWK